MTTCLLCLPVLVGPLWLAPVHWFQAPQTLQHSNNRQLAACGLAQTVEDKIRARAEHPDEAVEAAAAARELTVSFNADVMDGLPWKFMPTQRSVRVWLHSLLCSCIFWTDEQHFVLTSIKHDLWTAIPCHLGHNGWDGDICKRNTAGEAWAEHLGVLHRGKQI